MYATATGVMPIFTPPPTKVSMPTFSPAGGTYSSPQNVGLTCATSGATIYYTVDGSEPSSASAVYSSPISVSESTTVKAKAFKSGMTDSDTASAAYIIILPKVATPTLNPSGGSYSTSQNVVLGCSTDGATIRYTTDGSEPSSASTMYSSSILINSTMTVKAKASKVGMIDSDIATATYTIDTTQPTGFLPPEAAYAVASVGIAAIIAIAIVVLKKQKKRKR